MKCFGCDEGKAVLTNKDYVTPEGVHLGPTYGCDNPKCIFFIREALK